MRDLVSVLRPLALAAADLAVGGVLYRQASVALGVTLVAAGVLVVGGVVSRTASRERTTLARLWDRTRTAGAPKRPVTRRNWTRL